MHDFLMRDEIMLVGLQGGGRATQRFKALCFCRIQQLEVALVAAKIRCHLGMLEVVDRLTMLTEPGQCIAALELDHARRSGVADRRQDCLGLFERCQGLVVTMQLDQHRSEGDMRRAHAFLVADIGGDFQRVLIELERLGVIARVFLGVAELQCAAEQRAVIAYPLLVLDALGQIFACLVELAETPIGNADAEKGLTRRFRQLILQVDALRLEQVRERLAVQAQHRILVAARNESLCKQGVVFVLARKLDTLVVIVDGRLCRVETPSS